ncbi:MAG: tetratricopeptide repeat protein [Phycisphaerae bacterium]|nr:tetratricopeptide repeat protein [Phycisphaerae bacterium]
MNDWFEAEQRVERAQQLSESQRFEEALAEIDVALSINPNNAAWHAQRGCLLDELGRLSEATEAYERSLDLGGDDHEVVAALGASLARQGRYARALEIFDELARTHPDFEPAYCHRIGIYAELDQHDRAEEMFYLAQQLDDQCPFCYFNIGCSLAERGETQRAIFCWKKALELDPEQPGVNRRIAQAYRSLNETDKARTHYLCELRDDPGNTDLLYEMAELSLEAGDVGAALGKLAHVIDLEPDHIESHFALGCLWLDRNRPAEACRYFEAVESFSGGQNLLERFSERYGETLLRLKRFAPARVQLMRAVREESAGTNTFLLLANCEFFLESYPAAADWYRRVLREEPDHALAHYNLGLCFYQLDQWSDGLRHLIRATEIRPDFDAAIYHVAVGHVRLRQWNQAREVLRDGRRTCPDSPMLGELSRKLGKIRWRIAIATSVRTLRKAIRRVAF